MPSQTAVDQHEVLLIFLMAATHLAHSALDMENATLAFSRLVVGDRRSAQYGGLIGDFEEAHLDRGGGGLCRIRLALGLLGWLLDPDGLHFVQFEGWRAIREVVANV